MDAEKLVCTATALRDEQPLLNFSACRACGNVKRGGDAGYSD